MSVTLALDRSGGAKAKRGKFMSRQLSLRSFQQTVKSHANTINKASNVKVSLASFTGEECCASFLSQDLLLSKFSRLSFLRETFHLKMNLTL